MPNFKPKEPRYDDIYFEGVAYLDRIASGEIDDGFTTEVPMHNEICQALSPIIHKLMTGKQKIVEEDSSFKITAYWVGKQIRVDIAIVEDKS